MDEKIALKKAHLEQLLRAVRAAENLYLKQHTIAHNHLVREFLDALKALDQDGINHAAGSALRTKRDEAVRGLWLVLREVSDNPEEMSDEDLTLFEKVTIHSAIQNRINPIKPTTTNAD